MIERLSLALMLAGCAQNAVLELQLALPPELSPFPEHVDSCSGPMGTAPQPPDCPIASCVGSDVSTCPSQSETNDYRCVSGACTYEGRYYANISVVDGAGFPFASSSRDAGTMREQWGTTAVAGGALADTPSFTCLSVVTGNPDIERLHVRIRYCRTPGCTANIDREVANDRVPEEWYQIEHPFYRGRRTYWRNYLSEATRRMVAVEACDASHACASPLHCLRAGFCGCYSDSDCNETASSTTRSACVFTDTEVPSNRLEGRCVGIVERCQVAGCLPDDMDSFVRGHNACETRNGESVHACSFRETRLLPSPCSPP